MIRRIKKPAACLIMALAMIAACLLAACGGSAPAATTTAAATQAAAATTAAAAAEAGADADADADADEDSEGDEAPTTTAAAAATTAAAAATTAAAAQDTPSGGGELFNPTGMPITNEPYTLDMLHVRNQTQGDDYQYNIFFEKLQAETNVIPGWITMWNTDFPEKRAIMFASGDLPSVIFGANNMSDNEILPNLHYFIPLNDLIEQYMPNLMAAFEVEPGLRDVITYLDGNIYTLPRRLPARPQCSFQPYINKQWLDTLGLEIPQTIDELYEVLKEFKNGDPNRNGIADEIPYTSSAGNAFFMNGQFVTLFCGPYSGDGLQVVNERASFVGISDDFRECIAWMAKCFSEGLIDNEYFTQDSTLENAKRQNEEICISGFNFGWTLNATFPNWADQFETILPPARADGKRYSTIQTGNMNRNEFEITIFCEHPEIAARWADQFYTYEASVQNFWGPFDDHCMELRDDGTMVVLPPSGDENLDYRSWWYSPRDFGPKFFPLNWQELGIKLELFEGDGDGLKLQASLMNDPYLDFDLLFPTPIFYTIEQTTELATLRTDIRTFVGTTTAKWISSGGIDAEWDGYVNQLRAMGLERFLDIHTEAYLANK
ncbi:MAG: hypothetical protein FWH01_02795 [Oscillospiraceae bacterium]|nr:hypothetical protein [Oscillospiraceae bacterium]